MSAYKDRFLFSICDVVEDIVRSKLQKAPRTSIDTLSASMAISTRYIIFIIFCLGEFAERAISIV
jgi:hypothetical protein